MKLVVVANIFFAALIKDGVTANLLFRDDLQLYVPEFIFEEFEKYVEVIIRKTHRSHTEFDEMLQTLKFLIKVVQKDKFANHVSFAQKISPDPNDVFYFALALHLGCPIWSMDKLLKNQSQVSIVSTTDLIHIL